MFIFLGKIMLLIYFIYFINLVVKVLYYHFYRKVTLLILPPREFLWPNYPKTVTVEFINFCFRLIAALRTIFFALIYYSRAALLFISDTAWRGQRLNFCIVMLYITFVFLIDFIVLTLINFCFVILVIPYNLLNEDKSDYFPFIFFLYRKYFKGWSSNKAILIYKGSCYLIGNYLTVDLDWTRTEL